MIARALPHDFNVEFFKGRVRNAYKITHEPTNQYLAEYLCQLERQEPVWELSLFQMITGGMRCKRGLASPERLNNPNFDVPFSIVFGDRDWLRGVDNGRSEQLIESKK